MGRLDARDEEARTVLHKLRYNGQNEELIDLDFREIRDVIIADRANMNTSWYTILTRSSWRKHLLLGCSVQAFGPLSGINISSKLLD